MAGLNPEELQVNIFLTTCLNMSSLSLFLIKCFDLSFASTFQFLLQVYMNT